MRVQILIPVIAAGMLQAGTASATIMVDQNVTPNVIFGSGNANGSFTTDDSANGAIELGLRGKLRHNALGNPENTFNSNGDGTYSFAAGVAPTQAFPTAVWSFEWSVNSNVNGSGGNLNSLFYTLGIDTDPGPGTSFITFDPINPATPTDWFDHAIGDNTTPNGGGTEATDAATYAALIAGNNVAQNSWKPHWFNSLFDPTVNGTYDFFLQAENDISGLQARTQIQIIVGAGAVPLPATGLLLLSGLISMGAVRSRRRAAQTA